MPNVTYPGTASPLRGLQSFAESERDVLFGRDRERDELASLVTSESFRAGLLYGESGVGKTSLLRAGLAPHLRDHGVVALFCEDNSRPLDSFAHALSRAAGAGPGEREDAGQFLARVVGEAMAGQLYLFILDEIGLALSSHDERITSDLGDLFTRVVTRSGGRARFLFSCASERVHCFGALERRTGSLFPPSSRFELGRLHPVEAAMVLDRTFQLATIDAHGDLASAIVEDLARRGPILPADLQISALAVGTLGITSGDQLARLGGASELERRWLTQAAAATGNERSALRLLAELSHGDGAPPYAPQWAAARASIDPSFAHHALVVLQEKGIVRALPVSGGEDFHFGLAHEILAPRVREVAAPARLSARRAFELLGSKAAQEKRLTAREWWEVRREGIVPATSEERAVLARTVHLAKIAAAVAAGIPLLILIVVYIAMSGSFYLDVAKSDEGVESVVVRAGKPGLGWFDWLPSSPGFGSIMADSGLSRPMVRDDAWRAIADHDISGDDDGAEYVRAALGAAKPATAALIAYATDGSESALETLRKSAENEAAITGVLEALRPIARGGPAEVAFVEQALSDASPAMKTAALSVAAGAASRRPGSYDEALAKALASEDRELRRLSFSAVRRLGDEGAQELYKAALALGAEGPAQRELLALVTSDQTAAAPSASSAVSVLLGGDIADATRQKARELLTRAFGTSPGEATAAAADLIASEAAAPEDRVLAIQLALDESPADSLAGLQGAAKAALESADQTVRAAALPLYARINPGKAAGDLALMTEDTSLPPAIREAAALAWGEVARTGNRAAQAALEIMLEDRRNEVRAAAARAYGYVGRASQSELVKMVKKEYRDVATGAAYGLANSAEVGASVGTAISGINNMWRAKGRSRRIATEVFARIAKFKPAPVVYSLAAASRMSDDSSLHPIGVRGLCNALAAGNGRAGRELARAADNPSVAVRRLVIVCVVDHPEHIETALRIATDLAGDSDAGIRAEAARVLASIAARGKHQAVVGKSLTRLARDSDREVRIIAIRALADLGDSAPAAAAEALPQAFADADETEKLAILVAGRKIGADDLVQLAIADESPLVRVAAIDTAIATASGVASTLNSALIDPDPTVRRAALDRLATGKHGMASTDVDQALALAIGDRDPSIADAALTTLARLGDPDMLVARLGAALRSRSERHRAQAAAACQGLTDHDPQTAIELLEPLLADPSHDVRVALLPSLARAYAATLGADELAGMLRRSETRPTRRLVVTAALTVVASGEPEAGTAVAALDSVAKSGPPLAALAARLGIGLVGAESDAIAFLQFLVP